MQELLGQQYSALGHRPGSRQYVFGKMAHGRGLVFTSVGRYLTNRNKKGQCQEAGSQWVAAGLAESSMPRAFITAIVLRSVGLPLARATTPKA